MPQVPFDLKTGGNAFHEMLSSVDLDAQLDGLKSAIHTVKSVAKRDDMVKQIKYLASLKKGGARPEHEYVLHNMPVVPPNIRPSIQQAGNRLEHADVTKLYQDHIITNNNMKELIHDLDHSELVDQRKALYDGAKAIMGVGDPITSSNRAEGLKGFLKQIGGDGGPKTGLFQNKILSKKMDFSGRATISAESSLGVDEAGIPIDMIWTMYAFHIIRDLVKNGYTYPEAKEAVANRTDAATHSMGKLIKQIPIILNRAPTLMQSNIHAVFPVPVPGKTIRFSSQNLKMIAGDFDGDALTVHVPMTPEAVAEARAKLLPSKLMYDFRTGSGNSLIGPGHEAILGSVHLTEPDMAQKPVEFKNEEDVLKALKEGLIKVNTPVKILGR